MTRIHIHEDDEGMRNVYPAAARSDAMDDLATARASAIANLAPGGIGWTDVHRIREPEVTFGSLELPVQTVGDILAQFLPRILQFEVGFGANNPFHYQEEDAFCFGFGRELYVKLERKGDHVSAIWYDAHTSNTEQLSALRSAFEALDKLHPCMLADYWLNTGGLIADTSFLDGYFAALQR